MPELPEVHALVADLGSRLVQRTVKSFTLTSFSALKTYDPPVEALSGHTVDSVTRHGKFLDFEIGGLHLIIHLALAGWIRWRADAPQPSKSLTGPVIARLTLDDGSGFDVTEYGTKKSLAIYVVRSPSEVPGIAQLGPDPLSPEFTLDVFSAILAAAGSAKIKGVLRNQSSIAGIGNAYSDEILYRAGMSPFKSAHMTADQVAILYEAVQHTLRKAIARVEGLSAAELKAEKKSTLLVHGRAGEPCSFCGDTFRQVSYSDSALQYCPTCQTGGKPLADRVLSRLLK